MTQIYGHKWTSSYGECDTSDTWAMGLSGITPKQLAAGMGHCISVSADRARTGEEDWPPTLGEFRAYCTPKPYPYAATGYSLPAPKISKEDALVYIERIRADLKHLNTVAPHASDVMVAREPGEDG